LVNECQVIVPTAPWSAAARRRLFFPCLNSNLPLLALVSMPFLPRLDYELGQYKAASSRRSPRRFAHCHRDDSEDVEDE